MLSQPNKSNAKLAQSGNIQRPIAFFFASGFCMLHFAVLRFNSPSLYICVAISEPPGLQLAGLSLLYCFNFFELIFFCLQWLPQDCSDQLRAWYPHGSAPLPSALLSSQPRALFRFFNGEHMQLQVEPKRLQSERPSMMPLPRNSRSMKKCLSWERRLRSITER